MLTLSGVEKKQRNNLFKLFYGPIKHLVYPCIKVVLMNKKRAAQQFEGTFALHSLTTMI